MTGRKQGGNEGAKSGRQYLVENPMKVKAASQDMVRKRLVQKIKQKDLSCPLLLASGVCWRVAQREPMPSCCWQRTQPGYNKATVILKPNSQLPISELPCSKSYKKGDDTRVNVQSRQGAPRASAALTSPDLPSRVGTSLSPVQRERGA